MDDKAMPGIDPSYHRRFELQSSQYSFPYHWVPTDEDGYWSVGRVVSGSYSYLGLMHMVAERVAALDPERLLDFGCGDGRLATSFAAKGTSKVVGVDLVESAILFARAFGSAFDDLTFEVGSTELLAPASFDVAVAMEVFEHIPDDHLRDVIPALARALDDGGHMVISVPSVNVPLAEKHERHYTPELLDEQMKPHFERTDLRYVHRTPTGPDLLNRLTANRLFLLRHPGLLRALTKRYKKRFMVAGPKNGHHIVATYKKVARP
jgi:SAM-dependent methyltransferase